MGIIPTFASSTGNPLFLLSFRQRNELAAIVERAGWTPIAARRIEKAEQRFIISGSRIALVDARGAFEDGLDAAKILADPVEANAAALLVLISKTDIDRVGEVLAAGATHYLASPFGEPELIQALRFADRYTVRVGGRYLHAGPLEDVRSEKYNWIFDRKSKAVKVDRALFDLLGLEGKSEDAVAWQDFIKSLGKSVGKDIEKSVATLFESREPTAFAHDLHGDGRMVHHLTFDSDNECVKGWVELPDEQADHRDISERDYLTGIGDAAGTYRWIDEHMGSVGDDSSKPVLLLVALHRFERINQAYGSATGDAVLQGMARRIERLVFAMVHPSKLVARLAGAQFAIGLGPSVSIEEAEFAAHQVAGVIEQPFVTDGQLIRVKIRCGIVAFSSEDSDSQTVMRRASAALAEARDGDSHPIRIFDRQDEGAALRDGRVEIDLRHALDRDEIEILYQPQVAVTSGAVIGVEALARWRHPTFGELGAIALFAAAERSDYLTELSLHVQKKAIETAAKWGETLSHLRLSVNVTAADMAEDDFVSRFSGMVDASGFDRGKLTAEVTESGLIEDLGVAASRLAELRAGGFRVAIDDFGTGYSSLAYLKSLPLDYLKVDRRLSQDITGNARDRIVVTGVIEMARSLGLSVIAEGVETEEQLALLAEQGCELYQGFLCAPPLTSDALAEFVTLR